MIERCSDDPDPAISIVVPVLNEERDIGRLLEEIANQTPPPGGFEVLVVDGGSSDQTREIAKGYEGRLPAFRLLPNPKRLSSAGRNVGARAARGRYLLFLDGHCAIPRRDYLVRTVEIFESTGAACLSRPQPLNRLTEGGWARAISAARHSWLGHNASSDIYGGSEGFTDPRSAGAAYERTHFDRLGGYDERFDACEDVEFNHRLARAGLPAFRHPDLSVHYRPRSSLRGLYRQMFRYGRGRARLMAKHPGAAPWPLILLTVLALGMVLMAIAHATTAIPVAAALVACWILLVLVEGIRVAGPGIEVARIALAFCAIYVGLLLGFWRGLLEFRRFRPRGPMPARSS